jgi:hypothetical protein
LRDFLDINSSNTIVSSISTTEASHLWDSLITRVSSAASYVRRRVTDDLDPEEFRDPKTGESHLIKVMKEHHLSKVEKREDLPRWLFEDEERVEAERIQVKEVKEVDLGGERRGRLGDLSDIFAQVEKGEMEGQKGRMRGGSASSETSYDSGYGSNASNGRNRYEEDNYRGRAGDKLKVMRDRKRFNN